MSDIISGLSGLINGQYYQPFQQSGGLTNFQNDLTQYGYQQNLLADESQFAGSGTGQSTMATQATGGSRLGQAQEASRISDVNAGAALQARQISEQAQGAQNQSELTQLANLFANQGSDAGFSEGFNNPPGGTQSG